MRLLRMQCVIFALVYRRDPGPRHYKELDSWDAYPHESAKGV